VALINGLLAINDVNVDMSFSVEIYAKFAGNKFKTQKLINVCL
jgi:hypothetical protein